jgi:hypothetical protein
MHLLLLHERLSRDLLSYWLRFAPHGQFVLDLAYEVGVKVDLTKDLIESYKMYLLLEKNCSSDSRRLKATTTEKEANLRRGLR